MFFILSKLLDFLINPYTWIFVLLIWAIISSKKRKRLLIITVIIAYFFSNSFIIDEFMRKWEIQTIKIDDINKQYKYAIVLGGIATYDPQFDRINFNRDADRLWHTIYLYRAEKLKKIVLSGGEGRILKEGYNESDYLRKFLIKIGINPQDIIVENKSRNTHENAVNCAEILKGRLSSKEKILIVTSAFHMRRASKCFTKQGFSIDVFTTDRLSGKRKFVFDHVFIPRTEAMELWKVLIHEVVGYLSYRIVGYI